MLGFLHNCPQIVSVSCTIIYPLPRGRDRGNRAERVSNRFRVFAKKIVEYGREEEGMDAKFLKKFEELLLAKRSSLNPSGFMRIRL